MGRKLHLVLLIGALMALVGCTSLLERDYVVVTTHSDVPEAAAESDALRVENYQELVNALLYLVNQGEETGTLRLYGYDSDTASEELTAACLEVSTEVPIGAYRVSYLQFDLTTIVSYLEADISITYRPGTQSMSTIPGAIGTSATRSLLAQGLESFQEEIVLQLNYFSGGTAELLELLERAYYEVPSAALGMPSVEIAFYPRTGVLRIAEITLSYPMASQLLPYTQTKLVTTAEELVADSGDLSGQDLIVELCRLVMEQGGLSDGGDTAYDALLGGGATSEGLALALTLLSEERGVNCAVVQGTLNGVEHFWNVVYTPWGYRHVDISAFVAEDWQGETITEDNSPFFSDRTAVEEGYEWNRNWVSLCGEQPEDTLLDGFDGM